MKNPKIKICCISSVQEAKLALAHGADALGLVSEMPSGPGVITEASIQAIIQGIPQETNTFLLTSRQEVDAIVRQYQALQPTSIQIVDTLSVGTLQDLKTAIPTAQIIQVIHVVDKNSIQEAIQLSADADALLLDSGNPNLSIKALGGTGKTHNWEWSRRIVEAVDIPVWLAGGLHAGNVAAAIKQVQPDGVDLCSGVRTNGQLDPAKLADFVAAVRGYS